MSERVSTVVVTPDPDGRWRVSLVAKRTYLVAQGGLSVAPEQVALVEAPRLTDDGVRLLHDCDVALRREHVDVVLDGYAYPYEGASHGSVSVRVGELARRLSVQGERRVELDARGEARFTPPAPFERVSLGWESAYGGYDAAALAAYGDPTDDLRREAGMPMEPEFGLYAYPRNPAGKGYLVELSEAAMARCRLPNLEDPAHALTPERLVYGNSLAWPAGPAPASTMWLPYGFFPRSSLLGMVPPMYDAERFAPSDFWEVRAGLLGARPFDESPPIGSLFDLRAAQCAAPGMRATSVAPGDVVEVRHAHPRLAAWRFALDVPLPRGVFRLGDDPPVFLTPQIRTVLLEPELDRVCLVWVAEAPLPMPLTPEQMEALQHAVVWE